MICSTSMVDRQVTADPDDMQRELLEELDALGTALDGLWREMSASEDPRIPVLSEIIETAATAPARDPFIPVANDGVGADPSATDAVATLVDELLSRWLPVIETELRERLQRYARTLVERAGPSPDTGLASDDGPT